MDHEFENRQRLKCAYAYFNTDVLKNYNVFMSLLFMYKIKKIQDQKIVGQLTH